MKNLRRSVHKMCAKRRIERLYLRFVIRYKNCFKIWFESCIKYSERIRNASLLKIKNILIAFASYCLNKNNRFWALSANVSHWMLFCLHCIICCLRSFQHSNSPLQILILFEYECSFSLHAVLLHCIIQIR